MGFFKHGLVKPWCVALGLTSAGAFISSGVYIFFILPKNAVEEAKASIKAEIQNQTRDVRDAVATAQADIKLTSREAERLKAELETQKPQIDKLKAEVSKTGAEFNELVEAFSSVTSDQRAAAIEYLKQFKEQSDLGAVAKQLTPHLQSSMDIRIAIFDRQRNHINPLRKELVSEKDPAKRERIKQEIKAHEDKIASYYLP